MPSKGLGYSFCWNYVEGYVNFSRLNVIAFGGDCFSVRELRIFRQNFFIENGEIVAFYGKNTILNLI